MAISSRNALLCTGIHRFSGTDGDDRRGISNLRRTGGEAGFGLTNATLRKARGIVDWRKFDEAELPGIVPNFRRLLSQI